MRERRESVRVRVRKHRGERESVRVRVRKHRGEREEREREDESEET